MFVHTREATQTKGTSSGNVHMHRLAGYFGVHLELNMILQWKKEGILGFRKLGRADLGRRHDVRGEIAASA